MSRPISHGDDGEQDARIGVDVGGTFTDVILQRPDGTRAIRKLLSTPPDYDAAVVEAVAALAADAGAVDGRRARDDRGDERGARAARRADGARHDRRLPRRARAAPAAHPAHVRPVLAQARPARARGGCGFEVTERMAADGTVLRPLDRGRGARGSPARLREPRRRVGRRLPAALLPLPRATRSSSARSCARSCRASRCRSRARSCASSASTSARRRRSSTPTSGR